jgi:hypothetical protein
LSDTTLLIAFDEAGLLEIRQQYLANPHGNASRIRERGRSRSALLNGPSGECMLEAPQVPNAGGTQGLQVLVDFKIGRVEQEYAVRRLPVAASASNLLHILLQRPGVW